MKKVLVIAMLTALSIFSCASCSNSAAGSSSPNTAGSIPVPAESAQTIDETSSIKAAVVSDATKEKILNYLKQGYTGSDIKILDYVDAGSGYILINFDLAASTNKFVLYNSKNNTYESLPVQDSNLIGVINENYFIFENKGDFTDSALRSIPYIEYCFRTSYNKDDDNFKTIMKNEMFDLTRKIQTGSKDNELLSSLVVTADGIEAVYKPSGSDDTQFYADATDIPTTITSYNPDIKQFVLEITTNQMSDKLKYNVQYPTEDNLYISSYQIISKENKTLILLTLRDNASGYTADVNRSTDTNQFPYFTLSFGKSPASQLNS